MVDEIRCLTKNKWYHRYILATLIFCLHANESASHKDTTITVLSSGALNVCLTDTTD